MFDQDFLEFSLFSYSDMPLYSSDFALVVDMVFLKACNVAFYYGARLPLLAPSVLFHIFTFSRTRGRHESKCRKCLKPPPLFLSRPFCQTVGRCSLPRGAT